MKDGTTTARGRMATGGTTTAKGDTTTARVSRVTGSTMTATGGTTTWHDDGKARHEEHNDGTGQHDDGWHDDGKGQQGDR